MRKYDFYMVKVIVDNVERVVETNRDKTSFKEMRELYTITKEKLTSGNVMFIGINSTEYNVILSKTIEKEEEMDTIISSLISNIKWIIEYSKKSNELLGSMNMSKDMYLKNIELFEDYLVDDDVVNRNKKEEIFDELRKILTLRRKVKYNNLLVDKICAKLNLHQILNVLEDSIKSISNNTCVNLSKDDIEKKDEHNIKEFFNMDTIEKISEMRKENDKILITDDKVIGYNKTRGVSKSNSIDETVLTKEESGCKSEEAIFNKFKASNMVIGNMLYKSDDLDFEMSNLICVDKKEFKGISKEALKGFIRNKSKNFNLITKKQKTVNCYKFETA